jgi:formylglycine-generating enzyme required for sulfatase activity
MGAPEGERHACTPEWPAHQVRITKPFYLAKYELTQAAYQRVAGKNPSRYQGDANPVEKVTWSDCVSFCQKLSQATGVEIRLPTEAEWEYACRAGTRTSFSYGDIAYHLENAAFWQLGEYAWYGDNSGQQPHPVGRKKPNPWGLYDMHGNVREWCADWFAENYYQSAPVADPQGPNAGGFRVVRGGNWQCGGNDMRCARRDAWPPEHPAEFNGFRPVAAAH